MDTATHEIELPDVGGGIHDTDAHAQLPLDLGDHQRLLELAAAVRDHQERVRGQLGSARAHDLALYRRLRQIGGAR